MSRGYKRDRRLWWLLASVAALSVLWFLITLVLLAAALEDSGGKSLAGLLAGPLLLLGTIWVAGTAAVAWGLKRGFEHWVLPSAQLAEEARLLLSTDVSRTLASTGSAEVRALADLFNQLVQQREALRQAMGERVLEASQRIEQERSRLAALMSELTHSVVVCNLDGHILLYNQCARLQLRALLQKPVGGAGAERVGLGRSIYNVLDRPLVDHALDNIRQRMDRGAHRPSAQFVTTTPAGQMLRIQMAPVRSSPDVPDMANASHELGGFVLVLDNITHDFEAQTARDQIVHALTEGSRSALANIQAALDMLDHQDLNSPMRDRFMGVIREETRALSQRIHTLEARAADQLRTRWPLEDMQGADLVGAATRRIITATGLQASQVSVDPGLWLKVESFSLLQALEYLARRLADAFAVRFVQLRLGLARGSPGKAALDLIWSGRSMNTETAMNWELEPITSGAESTGLTVRDVVERHGGAFWFERERTRQEAFFRILLPLADPQLASEPDSVPGDDSRPAFYDFDLFRTTERSRALDDRPLRELIYTVFDTETTGLHPGQGDEIIQIGAVRIVNGRLLRHECFEQLVNPCRPVPASSIAIHGIPPERLVGQPTIEQVLPAFHAFAQDSVLVAHNAAFDMRFLQVKEPQSCVVFDHPVLDTLLLSALVHPSQASHRLERIAERFNVNLVDRHTAMGDACVTAEIFLKLIPLLAEQGIHTLGQAREAAQKTYYARIRY